MTGLAQAAFYLTLACAASVIVSNAVCQILLGAAVLALLVSRQRLELPPFKLPLALFAGGTIISLLLSANPSAGVPQLKKFYVFLILAGVYTTVRRVEDVRRLFLLWGGLGTVAAVWSFAQFWMKRERALAAHQPFYQSYIGERITGFMGHWMTFSGEQMIVLLAIAALLLFAPPRRHPALLWSAALIIFVSIVLGMTRGIWGATAAGGLYLIANWRPKLLAALPLVLAAGVFAAPRSVQERFTSIYQPHGTTDSNEHRRILRRTGWEMIKAHPWFGLGPEHVNIEFRKYLPADVPRPLPSGWYGHLHNIYLQYAAERGIPVLIALLWLIGKAAWDFFTAARKTDSDQARAVLHGCVAVIVAILVGGIFEMNLGDSEVLTMFLAVLAFGYAARRAVANV